MRCEGSTDEAWEDFNYGTSDAEDRLARKFYEEDLKAARIETEGSSADMDLIRQEAQSNFGDFECYFGAKAKARSAVRGTSKR